MGQLFPGPLSSGRVCLRRLEAGDAEALCHYRSLPEVARYQSWESFGPNDAESLIHDHRDREPGIPGTWFQMAIVESATGCMIGDCGLRCLIDDPRQMELGVTLATSHQGRGYATEALGCLLDFVFGTLGAHRVSAVTDADNARSAALFKRLGFRQEAHFIENIWFKGQWGSEFKFALLRREWELRQAG